MMRRWGVAETWDAAVEVAASVYGVDQAPLRAQSRGRGPRPPRSAWAAKKMAVHLTVLVCGCERAELGRLIGFHRDTIASHCAEMQDATDADTGELLSLALERIVRGRLESRAIAQLAADRARLAMLEETTRELVSVLQSTDARPTKTMGVIRPEHDHADVIALAPSRRSAR